MNEHPSVPLVTPFDTEVLIDIDIAPLVQVAMVARSLHVQFVSGQLRIRLARVPVRRSRCNFSLTSCWMAIQISVIVQWSHTPFRHDILAC